MTRDPKFSKDYCSHHLKTKFSNFYFHHDHGIPNVTISFITKRQIITSKKKEIQKKKKVFSFQDDVRRNKERGRTKTKQVKYIMIMEKRNVDQ